MRYPFYDSEDYKRKQGIITKAKWKNGIYKSLSRKESRLCAREECSTIFEVIPSDKKKYCSHTCAAIVNNIRRGKRSLGTRLKISRANTGRRYLQRTYKSLMRRNEIRCGNPACNKLFSAEAWKKRKYCSPKCAIKVTGGRTTSPKAARGKAGIRKDINKKSYFYSRWEANVARLLNLLGVKWIHQPQTFNLRTQYYTPDFYLPEFDMYIEVKNFMSDYSKKRDRIFRKLYPGLNLLLILKKDYLQLEESYSQHIKKWEFRNSPFNENG